MEAEEEEETENRMLSREEGGVRGPLLCVVSAAAIRGELRLIEEVFFFIRLGDEERSSILGAGGGSHDVSLVTV